MHSIGSLWPSSPLKNGGRLPFEASLALGNWEKVRPKKTVLFLGGTLRRGGSIASNCCLAIKTIAPKASLPSAGCPTKTPTPAGDFRTYIHGKSICFAVNTCKYHQTNCLPLPLVFQWLLLLVSGRDNMSHETGMPENLSEVPGTYTVEKLT